MFQNEIFDNAELLVNGWVNIVIKISTLLKFWVMRWENRYGVESFRRDQFASSFTRSAIFYNCARRNQHAC